MRICAIFVMHPTLMVMMVMMLFLDWLLLPLLIHRGPYLLLLLILLLLLGTRILAIQGTGASNFSGLVMGGGSLLVASCTAHSSRLTEEQVSYVGVSSTGRFNEHGRTVLKCVYVGVCMSVGAHMRRACKCA